MALHADAIQTFRHHVGIWPVKDEWEWVFLDNRGKFGMSANLETAILQAIEAESRGGFIFRVVRYGFFVTRVVTRMDIEATAAGFPAHMVAQSALRELDARFDARPTPPAPQA